MDIVKIYPKTRIDKNNYYLPVTIYILYQNNTDNFLSNDEHFIALLYLK